jgi:hypothetical protein
LKADSNEGHFTLEAETALCPYLRSHFGEETKISLIALRAHALQAVQVGLNSVSNEGHFTLDAETIFRTISPGTAVG